MKADLKTNSQGGTDADAAHARLVEYGFDVSDVREGRKPGTRVLTVRDAGIPVVGYNAGAGPLVDDIDYLTYLGQDEYAGGYLGGLKLAAEGGTQGVCINQQVGHTGLDKRCAGFTDALAEKGIPAEVLATVDDPAESQTIISDYFTANPDTDIVMSLGPNVARMPRNTPASATVAKAMAITTA